MFWTAMIAFAIGTGYLAAFVGIPPVEMFAITSFAALCAEYVRRLCYRYLKRRYNG